MRSDMVVEQSTVRPLPRAAPLVCLVALLWHVMPAAAHHSYAMFDKTQTLSITGTLYALEWTNPHSWVWVEVHSPGGSTSVWGFEGASPAALTSMGYSKTNLVVGTPVTVKYNPMKDGRMGGNLVEMKVH